MPGRSKAADGQARRKLRTRMCLLDAARALLAEGRGSASIEEITKRAGVGFGSFFNHFPGGKDELFDEAVLELLDGYAEWIRSATHELEDPAEVFGRSFRLTGRLAAAQPDLFAPLLARGSELLLLERGLREVAIVDLARGVESGRFVALPAEVHLMSVGGVLLGLVQLLTSSVPDNSDEAIDAISAGVLRLLGVPAGEADELVKRSLPDLPAAPVVVGDRLQQGGGVEGPQPVTAANA